MSVLTDTCAYHNDERPRCRLSRQFLVQQACLTVASNVSWTGSAFCYLSTLAYMSGGLEKNIFHIVPAIRAEFRKLEAQYS